MSTNVLHLFSGADLSDFDFGQRLAEERKRLKYNQTVFGRLGGVTKTSQVNYEAGERSPSVDYWQAVAKIGVDVAFVITGRRESVNRSCPMQSTTIAEPTLFTPREMSLIDKFRLLDEPGKQWLFGVLAERMRMIELEKQVADLIKHQENP